MIHWLKLDLCNKKSIQMLKEYNDTHDCKMECFYCETNIIWDYIRLECSQSYDDLDLDCNSFSSHIYHLERKPSNLYKSKILIEDSFNKL